MDRFPRDQYALDMLTQAAQGMQQQQQHHQQQKRSTTTTTAAQHGQLQRVAPPPGLGKGISNQHLNDTRPDPDQNPYGLRRGSSGPGMISFESRGGAVEKIKVGGEDREDVRVQGGDVVRSRVSPRDRHQQHHHPFASTDSVDGGSLRREESLSDRHHHSHQHLQQQQHGSYDLSAISSRSMEFSPHPLNQTHHHARGHDQQHMGYMLSPTTGHGSTVTGFHDGGFGAAVAAAQSYSHQTPNVNVNNDLGILNAETFDDGEGMARAQREFQHRLRMQQQQGHGPSVWGYVTDEASSTFHAVKPEIHTPLVVAERDARRASIKMDSRAKQRRGTQPHIETSGETMGTNEDVPESGKRKKRKLKAISSPSPEEEDEASKKARGRPRVDPKDETPAERRRTQIRLAQRAYRNRKETTISSLEQTVQEMKQSSREVNTLFLKLFDLASSQGILGRSPDLAKRLEEATKKIRSSEGPPVDHVMGDDDSIQEAQPNSDINVRNLSDTRPIEITPPMSEYSNTFGSNTQVADGAVEEVVMQDEANTTFGNNMQIITRPTEDNASFPFDFMELQQYKSGMIPMREFSHMLDMQPNPSLPASAAYLEISFARRVQRQTTESALRLASMPNPPSAKWSRVFGITSQFESRPQIIARLQRVLQATKDVTLEQWDQPFVHYGGSGTHYPMRERDVSTVPKLRTGYGMGPFTQPVIKFKDKMVEDSLTLDNLRYHKDTYFDSNDIECYLETLGISINPSQDFVSAVVDLTRLRHNAGDTSPTQALVTLSTSLTSQAARVKAANISNHVGMGVGASTFLGDQSLHPSRPDISPQSMSSEDSSSNSSVPNQNMMSGMHTFESVNGMLDSRSVVSIDVSKFITELVNRCTCLGRAPGYKPAHVNQALLASITMD